MSSIKFSLPKKLLFMTSALMLTSANLYAADGVINFTGNIISTTCKIKTGDADKTVPLGNISASSLSQAGDVSALKDFSISLTDCSGSTKVGAYFESLDLADTNGYLKLDSLSDAKNVNIGIYDNKGVLQPVNGIIPDNSYFNIENGVATLLYAAGYHATGVAEAGKANSKVSYTLTYQ